MMKTDFAMAITQLAAERNLPRETVISAIESALASAFRKELEDGVQNVSVRISPGSGDMQIFADKIVVEDVEDPSIEIDLESAREIKSDAQLDDDVEVELYIKDAGRIAAQTTKQVVLQRLRAAQSDMAFEEFASKRGDMLSAIIQKVEPRQVVLDLGRAEAVIPTAEQVSTERYRPSQRLKVLITDVQKTAKGLQVVVSRSHKDLLRRLFELEVPEIMNGTVVIRSIAREPGVRSKVAVEARQEGVDAVGSCVGLRGIRIQNIVNELQSEKIDVVQWARDPGAYIANALSPAQVNSVAVTAEGANITAEVIVPDRQLSLAIGREGQNARLAAKLTGWRIDIKSVTESLADEAERATRAAEEPAVEVADEQQPAVAEVLVAESPVPVAETVEVPAPVLPAEQPEPVVVMEPAAELQVAEAPAPPAPVAEPEPEELPAPPVEEEDEVPEVEEEEPQQKEQEPAAEAFDFQKWVRSQQPQEDRPVLRFAEDILPDRGGGGRTGRRRGGNRPARNPNAGRGPNRPGGPPGGPPGGNQNPGPPNRN